MLYPPPPPDNAVLCISKNNARLFFIDLKEDFPELALALQNERLAFEKAENERAKKDAEKKADAEKASKANERKKTVDKKPAPFPEQKPHENKKAVNEKPPSVQKKDPEKEPLQKSETTQKPEVFDIKNDKSVEKKVSEIEKRVEALEEKGEIRKHKSANENDETIDNEIDEADETEENTIAEKPRSKRQRKQSSASSKKKSVGKKTSSGENGDFEVVSTRRTNDAFEIGASFCVYPANTYYLGTLVSSLGYFCYSLASPFYFGVDAGFGTGFPSKKFPYEYYLNGEKMKNPYEIEILAGVPLGFYFMPFQNNLAFRMEIEPSFSMKRLWNGSVKKSIQTKFYPSFTCDLRFLFQWKRIALSFGARYDTYFKFAVSTGLKFRIEIKKRSKR